MMKSTATSKTKTKGNDVKAVIIGMSCRFPGGVTTPQEFYEKLRDRIDCIEEIPSDRWNGGYYYNPRTSHPGTVVTKRCGFMTPFFEFDNDSFDMSMKEAQSIDPSIKILLEVAMDCFQDANVQYQGSRCGVFMGTGQQGFSKYATTRPEFCTQYSATGTSLAIHSNMISYKFDLRGPSFSCDSACSSSGSALYAAVNALMAGDIEMALVGGYNHLLNYATTVAFSRLGVLTPDGKGKSLDASANGYVRSEGCGMVVIKREDLAVRDGDHIYARVLSVGSNVDGALEPSLTKPSAVAQGQLMSETLAKAKVKPNEVFYVSAHATGTQAGDSTEANGIGKVCGQGRDRTREDQRLRVGAVKNNIGHSEIASFMAGLIKCCLMIDKGTLLPTIHVEQVNPKIRIDEYHMKIQTELEEGFDSSGKIFAINSFGFGGSNTCCVIQAPFKEEDGKDIVPLSQTKPKSHLYLFSARTKGALKGTIENWVKYSTEHPEIDPKDISWTLNTKVREGDRFMSYVVGPSLINGPPSSAIPIQRLPEKVSDELEREEEEGGRRKMCFVFSGQGPQHLEMGRTMYREFPVFRKTIDKLDELYVSFSAESTSIKNDYGLFTDSEEVLRNLESYSVKDTSITLPGLLFIQIGLFETLKSYGIIPDLVIGHSFGEMCMMYACGCLTMEEVVKCCVARVKLLKEMKYEHDGKMIAVGCSSEEILKSISDHGIENVWVSADNSPISCTIGGIATSVEKLDAVCRKKQIFHRILKINNAYHTPLMEVVKSKGMVMFNDILPSGHSRPPKIPFVSTVNGELIQDAVSHTYFCDNIINTVKFKQGVSKVIELLGTDTVFVEIAPHPVLGMSIKQCDPGLTVLPTLNRRLPDRASLLSTLGQLSAFGFTLVSRPPQFIEDLEFEGRRERLRYTPGYAFQRKDCFFRQDVLERKRLVTDIPDEFYPEMLGRRVETPNPTFHNLLNCEKYPWIADHVVGGVVVCPAAGYVEVCLEFMKVHNVDAKSYEMKEFSVLAPMTVPKEPLNYVSVQTSCQEERSDSRITVSSRPHNSLDQWNVRATTIMNSKKKSDHDRMMMENVIEDIKIPNSKVLTKKEVYDRFSNLFIVHLGDGFQTIQSAVQGDEEVLCTCQFDHLEEVDHIEDRYVVHPIIMDSLFHSLLLTYDVQKTYLPTSVRKIIVNEEKISPGRYPTLLIWSRLYDIDDSQVLGQMTAIDPKTNKVLIDLIDVRCSGVMQEKAKLRTSYSIKFQPLSFPELSIQQIFESMKKEKENQVWELAKEWMEETEEFVFGRIKKDIDRLKTMTIPLDRQNYWNWVNSELKKYEKCVTSETKKKKLMVFEDEESEGEEDEKDDDDDDNEMKKYENIEKRLLMSVITDFQSLVRKKKNSSFKSDELIGRLFSQESISLGPACSFVQNVVQEVGKLCVESSRVLNILVLETDEKSKKMTNEFLDPILKMLEGKVSVVNVPGSKGDEKENQNSEEEELIIRGLPHNHFDLMLLPFPSHHSQAWVEGMDREDWVKDVLTKNGIAISMEWASVSSFWTNFVFGCQSSVPFITDAKKKKNLGGDIGIELMKSSESFEVSTYDLNACTVCIGRKKGYGTISESPTEDGIIVFDKPSPNELLSVFQSEIVFYEKLKKKIIILTFGAIDPVHPKPEWASLIGMGRVLSNEIPEGNERVRMVDVPSSFEGDEEKKKRVVQMVKSLFTELEPEIVIDENYEIFVPRCLKNEDVKDVNQEEDVKTELKTTGNTKYYRLDQETGGILDSLRYVDYEYNLRSCGPNEIVCKVHSASLNFKDVMLGMGMLPGMELRFGLEFSGVITRLGKNLNSSSDDDDLSVGDEVFGFAPYCIASHVRTIRDLIVKKPKHISHDDVCGVPTVFATVYQSLIRKAGIQKGDRVLIHSASGGVGQAALELVLARQAIPICTVGSVEKRRFLREKYGVEIFGDSHSETWDVEIQSELRKRGYGGVNVVLNSLNGSANIKRGLEILEPFGSFIEIGKRDLLEENDMPLNPFLRNLTYYSVHIDHLIINRPKETGEILRNIVKLLDDQVIRPVITDRVFSASQIIDSFRYMSRGKHRGKIAINFECFDAKKEEKEELEGEMKEEKEEIIVHHISTFSPSKVYIISGGLGSLGFELMKFIVDKGGRKVVLLSRSGRLTKRQKRDIQRLNTRSAKVGDSELHHIDIQVSKTDICDLEAVKSMYQDQMKKSNDLGDEELEIGGIFHCAMVLQDARIEDQTEEMMDQVIRPKRDGAIHLVSLAPKKPGFVIFFSSISGVMGNPGQVGYAAGNCFLDSYAKYLRAKEGIVSVSIDLGAIEDVGVIVGDLKLRKMMQSGPIWGSRMRCDEVLKVMEDVIGKGKDGPSQVIPEISFSQVCQAFPCGVRRFDHLIDSSKESDGDQSGGEGGKQGLDVLSLKKIVSGLLMMEVDDLVEDEPLVRFGVDSLMAVEISSILKKEFGVGISQMDILGGASIDQIVKKK